MSAASIHLRTMHPGLSTFKVPSSISLDNCNWVPMLGISENYLLEHEDSQHRNRDYLWNNYNHWRRQNSSTIERYKDLPSFFEWLNNDEGTIGVVKGRIEYFNEEKRQKHQITIEENGYIRNSAGDKASTMDFKGKKPQYAAYVMDEDGNFFIAEHEKNKIQHTSFLCGKKVVCAGMIKIEEGKIVNITNRSGHYKSQLKNLYEVVRRLPSNVFSDNSTITHSKPYFPAGFLNGLASFYSSFSWIDKSIGRLIRKIGRGLQSRGSTTQLNRENFINHAEKKLSNDKENPLLIRDSKGNRIATTLQETLLAKAIVENHGTWSPTVLKINQKIVDIVKDNLDNPKIRSQIRNYLRNIPKDIKGTGNLEEKFSKFMLENRDPSQTILFHKDFFEDLFPLTLRDDADRNKFHKRIEKMRSEQYFSREARGRKTVRSQTYTPKTSYRMGITNSEYTPKELQAYYKGKQGLHNPGYSYFKFKGKRATIEDAMQARGNYDPNLHYSQQVSKYDIPFIAGPSGTASKILTPLLFELDIDLSKAECQDYLMALSGTLVANGHHSFYEVMVVGNLFGMQNQYDTNFYTDKVMTDSFKKSPGYTQYQFELAKIKDQYFKLSGSSFTSTSKITNTMKLQQFSQKLARHPKIRKDRRMTNPRTTTTELKDIINNCLKALSLEQVLDLYRKDGFSEILSADQFLFILYDVKYSKMKSIEKSLMEHLSQKLSDAPEKIEKVDKATRFEKIAAITTSKRLKVVKLSTTLRCTCNRGDVENINYRLK